MELNDSNIKKLRWLIVFTVAVVVIGVNYRRVFAVFMMIFGFISPFLLGGVMAFILNVPMRRIEKLLPMKENNRLRRPIGLVLTLLFVVGLLLLVIYESAEQYTGFPGRGEEGGGRLIRPESGNPGLYQWYPD